MQPRLGHSFPSTREPRSLRRARGRRGAWSFLLACFGLAACCVVPSAGAQIPEADALIATLARTPPSSVAFTEARFSPLLVQPIVVSGELSYPAPQSLERIVTAPYRERTSIRGDSVTVERDGERARTFALRRAPELRGLLTGFVALLAGDAAAVRSGFSIAVSGSSEAWRLELIPTDANVERRLTSLVATGARGDLRCFTIRSAQGGTTVMLLGAAAASAVAADATLESLRARCEPE